MKFIPRLLAVVLLTTPALAVPGDLDLNFSTPLSEGGGVYGLAQQADGKVFAVGGWGSISGSGHRGLGRFDAVTGALDAGYTAATTGQFPRGVRFQADGKLLIYGGFSAMNGVTRSKVARLNADGTLDTSFVDPQVGDYEVYAALPQPDGKILICGNFTSVASVARNYIARLNADGTLDTDFDPNANSIVQSMALLPNGQIVLIGNFSRLNGALPLVNRRGIAILNTDGTLDATSLPTIQQGYAVAAQPDGKIIVGGQFTQVFAPNGITRNGLVRLNADRTVDTSFDPDLGVLPSTAAGQARSIALQADGKIIIAGDFVTVGGVERISAARLNADGSLDTSFNANLNGTIANAEGYSALIQGDGKMLFGGFFSNSGTVARPALARFDNSLPTEQLSITNSGTRIEWLRGGAAPEASRVVFEQSTDSGATWTTLGDATRITGGWELTGLSLPANVRIRASALTFGGSWNGSGGLVQTVDDFPLVPPALVVEQPTSTPLANGATVDFGNVVTGLSSSAFTFTVKNTGSGLLKRLQLSIDGAQASEFALTAPSVSEVTAGGSTTFSIVFTPGARLARTATLRIGSNDPTNPVFTLPLTGTGVASPNADLASIDLPSPMAVSPAFAANTLSYTASAIFNKTSLVITPTAVNAISGITVNGTAVVSGTPSAPITLSTGPNVITIVVTAENGVNTKTYTLTVTRAVASLGGDLDLGFSPYVSQTVRSLAMQADGKILVGGIFPYVGAPFNSVGNLERSGLARLNPDNTWDASFDPQLYGVVLDMRQLASGQVVIAGTYAIGSGQSTSGVALINADGSRVTSFDTRMDGFVNKVAIDSSGRFIVVGEFTTVQHLGAANPTTRNRIARLNANGTLDTGFNPNVDGNIRCLLVQPDGDILIGGDFTQVGSTARSYLARINSTGSVDAAFTADAVVDSFVTSLAVQPDGKILVGGVFGNMDGLVRLNANGTLDTTFIGTSTGGRQVFNITVLDNGKLLISGYGDPAIGGHSGIERLNADGTLDTSFNASINTPEYVYSTLITDSGKIIAGGQFTAANGVARNSLARFESTPSQVLAPLSGNLVEWQRPSQPVASATAFDVSTDGGTTWTLMDATGTRVSGTWQGTSATALPSSGGLLRARATIPGGQYAGELPFVSTYSPAAAEIVVEQPADNELADGDTINFGTFGLNVLNQITFTVRNAGGSNLTSLSASIVGTNANQFSVIDQPDTSVASLESTTFTVQAKVTTVGAKTATLRVASNDSDENPFDIIINATGVAAVAAAAVTSPATAVVFDTSTTGINIAKATLNGTVDANGAPRDVFFDYGLTTAYGTTVAATPASLSTTTADPVSTTLTGLMPHTTYHFRVRADGPLGDASGANRTFLTPNRAPSGTPDTAIVLPLAAVTIDVLDNDTDADGDTLIISAKTAVTPATAGTLAIVSGNLVFTASAAFGNAANLSATFGYTLSDTFAGGTATSTVTVTPGSCSLSPTSNSVPSAGITYPLTITANGAPWNVTEALAWATISPSKGIGDATVQVSLTPNTAIAARTGSIKIGGVTHTITQAGVLAPVISPAVLTGTSTTGPFNTVVGDSDFSVTIPCTNFPVTFSVASGTLPPGLTLNATTGVISGRPTAGGTAAAPTKAYPLTIKATNLKGNQTTPSFTINVDALPSAAVGSFVGYVTASATAYLTANPQLGGRFELTTQSNGSFTGQIYEGVTKKSFSGTLAATLATKTQPTLTASITGTAYTLDLTLDATAAAMTTNTLTGTLHTAGNAQSTPVTAWRNAWSIVAATLNKATRYVAQHNFFIGNPDTANGPQGFGYGNFIVTENTGAYTIKGKLPDGSDILTTAFIGQQGQVLLYQSLHGNRGACGGVLIVDPSIVGDNQTQGAPIWFKPAPLANSKDTVYKAGFGPLTLDVEGNPYVAPGKGLRVMSAPAVVAPANNATATFTGGGLAAPFSQALRIANPSANGFTNTATFPAYNVATSTNLNKVAMPTLTAATGLFAGSFIIDGTTPVPDRTAPYFGQIIRAYTGSPLAESTRGYGYFLLPSIPGTGETVVTSPKLSGSVSFTAP